MFDRRSLLFFFATILFLCISGAPPGLYAQKVGTSRDPFVLDLPGISSTRYTRPVVRLAQETVPSIRFHVIEPFAAKISYGNIIVTLNGDGINRGCEKTRDQEGKVVTCGRRQDRLGGYDLSAGKNILEIRATDTDSKEYYASFVIILGDQSAAADTVVNDGKIERFTGRKFAVIIGISEYRFPDAGLRNLSFAADDARSMAAFLRSPEGGKFSPNDIRLLINEDASIAAVRSALNETAKSARAEDLIFIYIAGHGAPDPFSSRNLYFLFNDTKVVDMERTAFPMSELKQLLETQVSAQRVLVFIDTCHSAGVNQRSKSIVSDRDLEREGDENNISNFFLTKQLYKQSGRAVLTSSDINEVSQESSRWGNHGVFTWALLEGLKGKADYNGDHIITAGEAFQYTRATVQAATGAMQNPIALPGSSMNLVLAVIPNK